MDDFEDQENLVAQATNRFKISVGGKQLPKNIPLVLIDNVSFHFKESVSN